MDWWNVTLCSFGAATAEIALFSHQPSPVTVPATEDLEVTLILPDQAQALVERQQSAMSR